MSEFPKYFILPTTTHLPDGDIRLGQVIRDCNEPSVRLLPAAEDSDLVPPEKIRKFTTKNWVSKGEIAGSTSAALSLKALNVFTVEGSSHRSNNEILTSEVAILETQEFDPLQDEFLDKAQDTTFSTRLRRNPTLMDYLKKGRLSRAYAYVVTGLKIARDPGKSTIELSSDSGHAIGAGITVDPQGAASLSGNVKHDTSAAMYQEGMPHNDYVYAYRLREIKAFWRSKTLAFGEHRKGGNLYGVETVPGDSIFAGSDGEEEDYGDESLSDVSLDDFFLESEDFGSQFIEIGVPNQDVNDGVDGKYYLIQIPDSKSESQSEEEEV